MCGNGHKRKQFEYSGSIILVRFETDNDKKAYGFNITYEISYVASV